MLLNDRLFTFVEAINWTSRTILFVSKTWRMNSVRSYTYLYRYISFLYAAVQIFGVQLRRSDRPTSVYTLVCIFDIDFLHWKNYRRRVISCRCYFSFYSRINFGYKMVIIWLQIRRQWSSHDLSWVMSNTSHTANIF